MENPAIIRMLGPDQLAIYAEIPMTIEVRAKLQIEPLEGGMGGLAMKSVPVSTPYIKDYDAFGGPETWPQAFDVSSWGFFGAFEGDVLVGAAAVTHNTGGNHALEGGPDTGVLWDLRVRSEARGRGVGRALVGRAASWLVERGCGTLKIETQNVNVGACAFYRACGCTLGAIDRFGYSAPGVSREAMLVWVLSLG